MMTYDDAYVVMCLCGIIFTVAALVGFCIERWADWQLRAAAHRLDAACWWPYLLNVDLPGTVGNPVDPSPKGTR